MWRSSPVAASAVDAGSDSWKRRQSLLGNRLPAPLTQAIAAIEESFDRPVESYQILLRLGTQGTDLRSFERDSRPFRIVLVVIGCEGGGLHDAVELAVQRRDSVDCGGPFAIEKIVHRCVLGGR
jgi:hypothetical protein